MVQISFMQGEEGLDFELALSVYLYCNAHQISCLLYLPGIFYTLTAGAEIFSELFCHLNILPPPVPTVLLTQKNVDKYLMTWPSACSYPPL